MDRYENPNDPEERRVDPRRIESSSDSGVTWFIVGALVIAAGVLAYLYFGNNASTTAEGTPPATEAPADTGRASTPAEPSAPAAPAPAPAAPANPAPATPPSPNPAQ